MNFHPHKIILRFPFSLNTPFSFLIAFTMIYINVLNLMLFGLCCLSYGIDMFMLVTSLIKDIKNDLTEFRKTIESKKYSIVSKRFVDAVEFHSIVKRCGKILKFSNTLENNVAAGQCPCAKFPYAHIHFANFDIHLNKVASLN